MPRNGLSNKYLCRWLGPRDWSATGSLNRGTIYVNYVFNISLIAKNVRYSLEICHTSLKRAFMRNCTRILFLLLIGFLVFSTPGCQTSKGGYGNTKHHNATGNKSAKKKNAKKKSDDKKKAEAKKAEENKADEESVEEGTSPTKEKEKEQARFGYGFNLGALQFAGNTFQFGLSPNIAYKFSDIWVAGFMLKVDYYYFKISDGFQNYKYSSFGLGPTVFTRVKPLEKLEAATPFMKGLFLQAEYEHATISQPYDEFGNLTVNGDKIVGVRRWEDYAYIGAGASSGYPFASFVSIHYNLLDDINHSRVPWNWRIGFTWNY